MWRSRSLAKLRKASFIFFWLAFSNYNSENYIFAKPRENVLKTINLLLLFSDVVDLSKIPKIHGKPECFATPTTRILLTKTGKSKPDFCYPNPSLTLYAPTSWTANVLKCHPASLIYFSFLVFFQSSVLSLIDSIFKASWRNAEFWNIYSANSPFRIISSAAKMVATSSICKKGSDLFLN